MDRTPVTATVRSGGLTPSDSGAAAELLAFNASVRQAGERMAVCPLRQGVASSEAESIRPLEGRLATLERGGDAGRSRGFRWGALEQGGDHPMGSRGVRMGRTVYLGRGLGFFESFPFLRIGRKLLALVGRIACHAFCVLRVI